MLMSYLVLYCYNTNNMPKEDIIEDLTNFVLQCQISHNNDCSSEYEGSSWETTAEASPQNQEADLPSTTENDRLNPESDSDCSSVSMEMDENNSDFMESASKPDHQNMHNMTNPKYFTPEVHVAPRVVNLKNNSKRKSVILMSEVKLFASFPNTNKNFIRTLLACLLAKPTKDLIFDLVELTVN